MPFAFMIKLEPDDPVVMAALMKILLSALRVNAEPEDQLIGSTTVILPRPPLPPFVVMVTSVLARLVVSVVMFTFELAVGVKVFVGVPPSNAPFASLAAFEMVISDGSNNHEPVLPFAAEVLTSKFPTFKICLPDVSTNPPSPLTLPPFALIKPFALV